MMYVAFACIGFSFGWTLSYLWRLTSPDWRPR